MDLLKVLAEMHQERDRLKTIIARLENLTGQAAKSRGRRVRKGMDAAARQTASLRMKEYWAGRKRQQSGETGTASE